MAAEGTPRETPGPIEPALQGSLVRLRARERADLPRLNEMFNDPDVLTGLMMTFPQSMEGIGEWAERTGTAEDQFIFVIETLDGREPVGICGLEGIDARARSADFGIWIGKPYWNRGYGTDATRTACRFGFSHMNLQRIELHVYATNPAAVRTYEKVGFKLEGTLREAQFLGGRYIDVVVMGLLTTDLID